MYQDIRVNCCQDARDQQYIQEDKIMDTTTSTYDEYIKLIAEEEERIEGIENDIQVKTLELDDVQNSIKEKERERLEEIKTTYEALVARRKDRVSKLNKLESELEVRRSYLFSLYEEDEYEHPSLKNEEQSPRRTEEHCENEERELEDIDFYIHSTKDNSIADHSYANDRKDLLQKDHSTKDLPQKDHSCYSFKKTYF